MPRKNFQWFQQSRPPVTSLLGPLLLENFAGTNGTNLTSRPMNVGGNWTAQAGGFQCNGAGRAVATSSGVCIYTGDAKGPDANVSFIANTASFSSFVSIVKLQDANNYWQVFLDLSNNGGGFAINEVVAGVATTLATYTISPTLNTDYTLQAVFQGPAIYAFLNGTNVLTWPLATAFTPPTDFQAKTLFGIRSNLGTVTTFRSFVANPVSYSQVNKGVLLVGDSITKGFGTTGTGCFGNVAMYGLSPTFANEAVNGSTLSNVTSRQTADAAILNGFGVSRPILVLMLGANDFAGSTTAAQLLSGIQTYCTQMKALVSNLYCIVAPCPPNQTSQVNTRRATYNPSLPGAGGGIDYGIDLTTRPTLNSNYWQDSDASDDTKFFQSGPAQGHPTDLTHSAGIAPYIVDGLLAA
jgi:lysophospholipase L1-like esterase